MVSLVVRKASAFDFLHAVDISGRCWVRTRRTFAQQARVLSESAAVSIVTGAGELVAVAGLYDGELSEGTEAWLASGPALKANILGVLRRLATSLEAVARLAPGLEITAYIDPRSVAGDRLAALLGFDDVGVTSHGPVQLRTFRRVL